MGVPGSSLSRGRTEKHPDTNLDRALRYPTSRSQLAAVLAALAGACGPGSPNPHVLGVDVLENPHNSISARVVVRARHYDGAFARYWMAGEEPRQTPAYAFGGDTMIVVPVLGLDTASTYIVEANLVLGDTLTVAVDTTEFRTGTLPDWVPALGAHGSDTTPGFLAFSQRRGALIIDNAAKVVWYRSFTEGTVLNFQAHPSGQYTIHSTVDNARQFYVLNELGEMVDSLRCAGYRTRQHDVLVEADGSAWLLCHERRTMDLSGLGGIDTARVGATVVQHLSSDGEVLFEWNAFDHFAIAALPREERIGLNVNFTHGNSVAFDTDGNLLLSFRSLNEVTKVDVTTGEVMWRFGGRANEFTILNDPRGGFQRQHGIRTAGPAQLLVFDNRNGAPSRFVRYLMNPVTRTAALIMEFVDAPDTWSPTGGSAQYYHNGHVGMAFGRAGRVVEIDESGNRAWEVTGLEARRVFRVQRISSLYPHHWNLEGHR
jgi:hypothetical protein